MKVKITGAQLTRGPINEGTFWAVYSCKRCKEELGKGVGRSPKEAKKFADKDFDLLNRNFCHICGLKLNNRNLKECQK